MATLAAKLLQYKNWFNENGGMAIYNELRRISNAANTAQLGDGVAHGTMDYMDNCDPDVPEIVHQSRPVGHTSFPTTRNGGEPPTQSVP